MGEVGEGDEPEDDGEGVEAEERPVVVECGGVFGGDYYVEGEDDCCYGL